MPVVETAIRVPGGDAVQTSYAVADGGGLAVVALENRSPAPIAVALSRRDVLTSHPPATVPVQGGDAPPDALVLPIGHRSTVVVALALGGRGPGPLPPGLPTAEQVVRGWLRQTEAGADLRLPESPAVALAHAPVPASAGGSAAPAEPAPFLVGVAELGRLGVVVEPWLDDAVVAADRLARTVARSFGPVPWLVDAGLVAAGELFGLAGHRRGVEDVAAARARRPDVEPAPAAPAGDLTDLAWALRRVAVEQAGVVDLFPAPFPPAWRGHPVEAYRVPVGAALLAVALRWHGTAPGGALGDRRGGCGAALHRASIRRGRRRPSAVRRSWPSRGRRAPSVVSPRRAVARSGSSPPTSGEPGRIAGRFVPCLSAKATVAGRPECGRPSGAMNEHSMNKPAGTRSA